MEWPLTLVFDIETDGLIRDCTKIHCLSIYDLDQKETFTFNDVGTQEPISKGLQMLYDSDCIIGHNIIGYDLPVIQKLYPWFDRYPYLVDTLLCSRLYHADMMKLDQKRQWKHMPLQMYGRHSLESYGYRLGEYKGSFAKHTDWKDWSQEMEDYCIQDVHVTTKLWHHFQKYLNG